MSYAVYKTEAIITRSNPHGEASQDITFLTKDLGKITARAQSSRKLESKMRMHLTRYNHVMIDLVQGKQVWRLTGVTPLDRNTIFENAPFLNIWHRIVSLTEHLIRGEEAHPELFEFFKKLSKEAYINEGLELFGVIHVLDMLGYWHGEKLPEHPTKEVFDACLQRKKELVKMINESIEATQIVV